MPTVVETEIDDMADWLAFEAAMVGYDLVTADEIQIANINVQLSPATTMFIDTPVTDYNHYIWIRGTVYSDGRADDVSGLDNSLIDGGWGVGTTLRIKCDDIRITDLEILDAGGTGAGNGISFEDTGSGTIGYLHVARCIIHNTGSNTNANNHGVLITGGLAGKYRARIHSNIIYGMGGPGIRCDDVLSDAASFPDGDYSLIANNTICYCCKNGAVLPMGNIRVGSTAGTFNVRVESNLSFNPSGSSVCYFFATDAEVAPDGDNSPINFFGKGTVNISSDTTGSTGYTSQTITNYFENAVDPASAGGQDFRLKLTAPKGIGEAVYFGDPMTMDVRRAGRAIRWDCGAYETTGSIVDFDADYEYPFDFDISDHPIRTNVKGWNETRRTLADIAGLGAAIAQEFMMGSVSFQPTWTATTTNPTLPSGRMGGRYIAIGKRCIATYHLYLDGDEFLGVGTWRWSLPLPAQSGPPYLGSAIALHPSPSSGANDPKVGRAYIPAAAQYVEIRGNLDITAWSPTVPHDWNGGDTLNFTIEYAID